MTTQSNVLRDDYKAIYGGLGSCDFSDLQKLFSKRRVTCESPNISEQIDSWMTMGLGDCSLPEEYLQNSSVFEEGNNPLQNYKEIIKGIMRGFF